MINFINSQRTSNYNKALYQSHPSDRPKIEMTDNIQSW